MNIILLSGGSGKRLWPLSNDVRSKQFLKLFKNNDGNLESMVQRVYRQIKNIDSSINITIATSNTQVSSIKNQLGDKVNISVEPSRRDTFPAILLAVAYLHDVQKVDKDEAVIVCPVDQYVGEDYFYKVLDLYKIIENSSVNIALLGIKPDHPSDKYGYIIPNDNQCKTYVKSFKEKPSIDAAIEYIKEGALWNAGVFAFKISYLLNKAKEILGDCDYYGLLSQYNTLKKISFDYEIVEKENKILVLRYDGRWLDLGSWSTLSSNMSERIMGDVVIGDGCDNVSVVNELDIPVLTMGIRNAVISTSPDGILVSSLEQADRIKPYVENIHRVTMYADKSWGAFRVIDIENDSMTIKVTIQKGDRMNYHSHEHRDEVWVVTSGNGRTIVDGMEQNIKKGDVITMKAGCRHTVIADTELKLIEVQLGKEISINDKRVYSIE